MNKLLAFRAAEILAVCTGGIMGIAALAALQWWLTLIGIAMAGGTWYAVYRILVAMYMPGLVREQR
jgi:hypothetical protein